MRVLVLLPYIYMYIIGGYCPLLFIYSGSIEHAINYKSRMTDFIW